MRRGAPQFDANEALARRCAIERRLNEFRNFASQYEYTVQSYTDQLLGVWRRLAEEIGGNYDWPALDDERHCDEQCMVNNWLLTLDADLQLYGCTEHATVHRCRNRERMCALRVTTSHTTVVCMFSGEEIDRLLSEAADFTSGFRNNDSRAGHQYRAAQREFDDMPSFTHLGRASVRRADGTLDVDAALARSAAASAALAALAAPQRSYRFGRKISELQRRRETQLRAIAQKVLSDVLFDKQRRLAYNAVARRETEQAAADAVHAYYSACHAAKTMPRRIDAALAFATAYRRVTLLPLVEHDRVRSAQFETRCTRLWALCHRSPYAVRIASRENRNAQSRHSVRQTTATYEQFCLGVLYKMRDGLVRGCGGESYLLVNRAYEFVPRDWRLHLQLPPLDNVDSFGDTAAAIMATRSEGAASTVAYGDAGIVDAQPSAAEATLFKSNGARLLRKKSVSRRVTTSGTGTRRVAFGRSLSVPESEILPPHLFSALLNANGVYDKRGVGRGIRFLDECIQSLPVGTVELEARALSL